MMARVARRSIPVARAPTTAAVTKALIGKYAAKSERPASTPNAVRIGWRRAKEVPEGETASLSVPPVLAVTTANVRRPTGRIVDNARQS
jgi:hypothetical protein